MGLSSALATAMSGLRANQASLSIISSNVANAQTPGYVNQNTNQIEVSSGTFGDSVQTTGVNRQLDLFVQSQLRTETSGGAYADQMSNILSQLQSVYGTPGGDGTLETSLSNFTASLQSLSSNPGNQSGQRLALRLPNGANIDPVAHNSISSGQIAADLKLRDQALVQAQAQVDQLAATLSSSLSDQTTAGTAVAGPPSGFDVSTSNLQPGNSITLTYTDTATKTQRQISIVN